MENNDLISIIIPCYNDWQYIEQAIDSVLNQTYLYKEVIVVDDGSNAKTKEVLKQLEPKITKLITQENFGQSKARNVGIEASKGDYILVLDSDDFFETTFCEKAVAIFLSSLDVKLVSCQANLIFENNTVSIYNPKGGSIESFLLSNAALGTSMFKKMDWKICGGYDESMTKGFEDWEFFIRLLKDGGNCYVIPEVLYNYRKRNESTSSVANKFKYDLLFYIYTKHKELFVSNYENFVSHLLGRIEIEEKGKIKYLKKTESKFLNVLRMIKSFFKNS